MSFLILHQLTKIIDGQTVVNNISFHQTYKQKVAIAGSTGSGKTTLLKMIAGLIQPTSGAIFFEGEKVIGPNDKLLPGHSGIAYLSQHFELRNNYFVAELLAMVNVMSEKDANLIYRVCKIEHLLKRRTDGLSGGERQRIALAKLLVTAPTLLLLDEPYSNLDGLNKKLMQQVVDAVAKQLNITCMIVSHNAHELLSWADWIMVMKDGAIVEQNIPTLIYHQPEYLYTAELFGNILKLDFNTMGLIDIPLQEMPNKPMYIRPEKIDIALANANEGEDIITKIDFFGNYDLVHVLVNKQTIQVHCKSGMFNVGQKVIVTIQPNKICYLTE